MAEKDIGTLMMERLEIPRKLEKLRESYLQRRKQVMAPVTREYQLKKKALEHRKRELEGLIANNSTDLLVCALTGQEKPKLDDELYGWVYQSELDSINEQQKLLDEANAKKAGSQ